MSEYCIRSIDSAFLYKRYRDFSVGIYGWRSGEELEYGKSKPGLFSISNLITVTWRNMKRLFCVSTRRSLYSNIFRLYCGSPTGYAAAYVIAETPSVKEHKESTTRHTVFRATPTLRHRPGDVLRGYLDIAQFTVYAVLSINHHESPSTSLAARCQKRT